MLDHGNRINWHEHYETSAAAWEKWAETLAAQQEKVCAALLDAAAVVPGHRVLDLASGVGEPALPAARRVGAHGAVVATDRSPKMLAALQRRAEKQSLSNVTVRTASMESLPFDDGSFDAVTCRYGLMYSDDPDTVLRECARVLRPRGRVAMMVWGPEASNTTTWPIFRALQSASPGQLSDSEILAPLRFADPGRLRSHFETAGLADIQEHEIAFRPKIKRGTPYWLPLVEMNAGEHWLRLDDAARTRAAAAISEALDAYRDGDTYVLSTSMWIVSGARS